MSFTGLVRTVVSLGLAVVTALGFAAPASAGSESVRDPAGDVLSGPYFSDDLPTRPEPERRVGDIVRTTVRLGTDLVVTTRFRGLAANGGQQFQWLILTSEDEFSWTADLTVRAGQDEGHFSLIDPVANQPGCGKAVLDRPGRRLTLTIPADCLGDPAWVRVAHGVQTFVGQSRVYADDARRDGGVRHGWKYGPKVTAS